MHFDGGFGKVEISGDELIAVSSGKMPQRFQLAGGELVERVFGLGGANQRLHQPRGHFGRIGVVAFYHFFDGFNQIVGVDVFQQKAAGAQADAFG